MQMPCCSNDDVGIEPGFLAAGLAVLAEHPRACIQAMGMDKASGELDHGAVADRVRLRFRPAAEGEAPNCLSTRGLLMSLRTFAASGGFRPDRLPHYLSDYEFTLRLARRGVLLVVDPRFQLVADHGSSGEADFDGAEPARVRRALAVEPRQVQPAALDRPSLDGLPVVDCAAAGGEDLGRVHPVAACA